MNFSSTVTLCLLDFFDENQKIADGLQDILIGNRDLSLISIFFTMNLILLANYFFSKSAIGILILSCFLLFVLPMTYMDLKEQITTFIENPIQNEYQKIYKRKSNDELTAAIATFSDNFAFRFIYTNILNLSIFKHHQIPKIIILAAAITLLFEIFGLIPVLVFVNLIFILFIFIIRYLLI